LYSGLGMGQGLLLAVVGRVLDGLHPLLGAAVHGTASRLLHMVLVIYHRMDRRIGRRTCVPMRSFDEEGSVPGRVNGAVEYTVPDRSVDIAAVLPSHDPVVVGVVKVGQ